MAKTKRTILFIDDNIDDLEFYSILLKRTKSEFEYQALIADNPDSGIELFGENKIDCIFVDWNMPQHNALEVIEMLESTNPGHQTPIAVLTGQPHQSLPNQTKVNDALDCIMKNSINSSASLEAVINTIIEEANTNSHT